MIDRRDDDVTLTLSILKSISGGTDLCAECDTREESGAEFLANG